MAEHLHHAEQRADHPPCWSGITNGAIKLATLLKAHQKIIGIALQRLANELAVITVSNIANALG